MSARVQLACALGEDAIDEAAGAAPTIASVAGERDEVPLHEASPSWTCTGYCAYRPVQL
jgi:hypothetical protein